MLIKVGLSGRTAEHANDADALAFTAELYIRDMPYAGMARARIKLRRPDSLFSNLQSGPERIIKAPILAHCTCVPFLP